MNSKASHTGNPNQWRKSKMNTKIKDERNTMKNGKLNGKVAVVTGASKGIGADIVKQFAAEGAAVVVNYASSKEGADRVVDQIAKRGGRAIAVRANVARKADIEHLFVEAKKAFGKIDILVNNAGVYDWSPLEEITEEQFHKHFDVNVLGLLLATQEAVKQFDSTGGNIINISSTVTSLTPPSSSVYTGTKGAVDAITRTLAKELGPRKIRVNAINPGLVETEGVRSAGFDQGDLRKSIEAETPLGRIGQPEDIAPAAVFLASSDSAWVTGETLRVAGGLR
jgi:3-oxoacyl-[acyl-carrier protein] reductase